MFDRRTIVAPMGTVFPALIFFKPTQKFIDWANNLPSTEMLVDCGAGMGHLHKCLNKVVCIDLFERDGQINNVLLMDAARFPFSHGFSALLCRPCHGAWVQEVFDNALAVKSKVYYVGLRRNLYIDTGDYNLQLLLTDAGEDGESVWQVIGKR